MPNNLALLDPRKIQPNPENPRLIFREDELLSLQDSISQQGILVPLSVFQDDGHHVILDGERRWRCAIKLGLVRVPAIVQPKPDKLTNIMMMFAIHGKRKEWDQLPTALKLRDLEAAYKRKHKRAPTEIQLAELASLSRSEVRRYKNLLALPQEYLTEIMKELEKPRPKQGLTVDQLLETTRGVAALRRREIITSDREEDQLRRAILQKFRSKIVDSTVAPRQLARMARAVERGDVGRSIARSVALRLINEPSFSISDAFAGSVEVADFEHGLVQVSDRLIENLKEHQNRRYRVGRPLRESLQELRLTIARLLKSK